MARLQIVAVRMNGGSSHRHIAGICYIDTFEMPFKAKTLKLQAAVDLVDDGVAMYTRDHEGFVAEVYVVHSSDGARYLRTKADDVWSDDLLRLPRYEVECKE